MTNPQIAIVCGLEVIALIVIARLWLKRRHKNLFLRLVWSIVLLVPLLGLLAYVFFTENPDEHPYDTDTMRGSVDVLGDGSGHHH